jgi:hypothetical protein
MITRNTYGLPLSVITGQKIGGAIFTRFFNVINAQLQAALSELGPGVVFAPDETSFQVSKVGNGLTVAPGVANILHSEYGIIAVESDTDEIPEGDTTLSATNYVFAQLILVDDLVSGDSPGDEDSRETMSVRFVLSDQDELEGGLLLAQFPVAGDGTIGTVVDRREPIVLEKLALRILQLESDVGYDATERAKGTVADRLNALSGSDTEPGTIISLLAQLKWSEDDARNAIVVLLELLEQLEARLMVAIQTGGRRPQQTPLDQLYFEHSLTRRTLIGLVPGLGEKTQSANVVPSVEGVFGDGTDGHPDFIDTSLTLNSDGVLEL